MLASSLAKKSVGGDFVIPGNGRELMSYMRWQGGTSASDSTGSGYRTSIWNPLRIPLMTDSLRNLPRYIRQADAFSWQGADSANGPWRSIPPPQSGTPWQTISPMDDIRQASAEVSGVAVLSPAAQAVMVAATMGNFNIANDPVYRQCIAAALRAAADRVVPNGGERWTRDMRGDACTRWEERKLIRRNFLAIAAELDP
jgi:hypothetical protein